LVGYGKIPLKGSPFAPIFKEGKIDLPGNGAGVLAPDRYSSRRTNGQLRKREAPLGRFFTMSIKTKIAGTVFLLVATLMVLLTLAGYRYLAHNFKETISRQHATILTMAARHIDDEV
jgi:hypothetical protein